ncbi:benzoate/H(+) symporter BenE family transporter [Patulibacter sp. NPDC049589]|uniref:benzoate/H(+) symporter BenE family transporter n=1 Tax=Patulibacter sp. NPDC049589 TaxID=3154731 RepID=UPI0034197205
MPDDRPSIGIAADSGATPGADGLPRAGPASPGADGRPGAGPALPDAGGPPGARPVPPGRDGHPGSRPIPAGVVGALVGFVGSSTVVLTGLHAVGASDRQAASGLLALCVAIAVTGAGLSLRTRLPMAVAWSTPGAALLISAGRPDGGFAAAVGAFLVCGALLAVSGLWGTLVRLVSSIPIPLAGALTASIVLPVCFGPARAIADVPEQALPVVLAWGVLMLVARRLAVPGALLALVIVVAVSGDLHLGPASELWPRPELTAPTFDAGALIGIALPLYVVTMVSQNVAGVGVLASFGYRAPVRPALLSTGLGSVLAAPFGGHAISLAALSAALVSGPDAGPHERRWVAGVANGASYVVLALLAGLAVAFVAATPPVLVQAVAGLALVAALEPALATAFTDPEHRPAAVATIVVGASGVTILGIGGAFWGLVAGLIVHVARTRRAPRTA